MVQLGDMIVASVQRRELLAHLRAERRKGVRLDPMLARQRANVEQPRFSLIQPPGIEGQRIRCPCNPILGLAGFDYSSIQSREGLSQQRMLSGAAFDPPGGLPELCDGAVRAAEHLVEASQRLPGLQAGLHCRPFFGQTRLLTFLRGQGLDLLARVLEIFPVALGSFDLCARLLHLGFDTDDLVPGLHSRARVQAAEGVEKRAVTPWVQ